MSKAVDHAIQAVQWVIANGSDADVADLAEQLEIDLTDHLVWRDNGKRPGDCPMHSVRQGRDPREVPRCELCWLDDNGEAWVDDREDWP